MPLQIHSGVSTLVHMEEALVATSVVLGLATIVLALFTALLWMETKAARQPRIVASLDYIAPNYGELRIVNAGAGAAIDIDISFDPAGGEQRRWTEPVLLPGDGVNFNLLSRAEESAHPKAKELDGFIEVFGVLKVSGSYHDVRDKSYPIEQTVDVEDLWSETKRAVRLAAYRGPLLPFYQLLDPMKKSLEKIASK